MTLTCCLRRVSIELWLAENDEDSSQNVLVSLDCAAVGQGCQILAMSNFEFEFAPNVESSYVYGPKLSMQTYSKGF